MIAPSQDIVEIRKASCVQDATTNRNVMVVFQDGEYRRAQAKAPARTGCIGFKGVSVSPYPTPPKLLPEPLKK